MYIKIINRFLKRFGIKTISSDGKIVYLTFDDGPEPEITEFVLEELAKYNFKATFFCRGDNVEKNPELLALLRKQGHTIGNHSYGHLYAGEVSAISFIADVEKADVLLHANLFRPPHGSLTLKTWLGLRNKYQIVYWSLNSGDSDSTQFNRQSAIEYLKARTNPGAIILFHFCHMHEKETRMLLPEYLKWLHSNGYQSAAITIGSKHNKV